MYIMTLIIPLQISLIEIPSYIASSLTLDHLGRKTTYIIMISLTAVGCFIGAFLDDGNAKTALCMVGKEWSKRNHFFFFLNHGRKHSRKVWRCRCFCHHFCLFSWVVSNWNQDHSCWSVFSHVQIWGHFGSTGGTKSLKSPKKCLPYLFILLFSPSKILFLTSLGRSLFPHFYLWWISHAVHGSRCGLWCSLGLLFAGNSGSAVGRKGRWCWAYVSKQKKLLQLVEYRKVGKSSTRAINLTSAANARRNPNWRCREILIDGSLFSHQRSSHIFLCVFYVRNEVSKAKCFYIWYL